MENIKIEKINAEEANNLISKSRNGKYSSLWAHIENMLPGEHSRISVPAGLKPSTLSSTVRTFCNKKEILAKVKQIGNIIIISRIPKL